VRARVRAPSCQETSVRGRVRMYPPPHMTHMYPLAGSHEFGAPVFSIYVFSM